MSIRVAILFVFLVLLSNFSFGQNREFGADNVVPSKATTQDFSQIETKVDTNKRYYVRKIYLKSFQQPSVKIVEPSFHSVSDRSEINQLPTTLEVGISMGIERKQAVAYVFIPRYLNINGQVEKLISFELKVEENSTLSYKTSGTRVYAANSILANGTWHKISIAAQGVYKIDYNFIKNTLNINPDNLNPAKIRLFGNGGEMLADNNAITRADDLVENAIEVVGGGDGKFDNGDFILFYANGPHTISGDSAAKKLRHSFNVYSEKSFYFLNFEQAIGKRIAVESVSGTVTATTNTANFMEFYEKDSINLGRSGKTWWTVDYSDQPGRTLSRTFSFNTPDIDPNEPIYIRTLAAAISSSGSSVFSITANGVPVHNSVLSAIGTSFSDPVANSDDKESSISLSASTINVGVNFSQGNSSAKGYLDFIELNGRRKLNGANYFQFADWNTVGPGEVVQYNITNVNANTRVWDVSSPLEPKLMDGSLQGSTLSFKQKADALHTFISFNGNSNNIPAYEGVTPNQNLHNTSLVDYIIISHPSLLSEANRLANYHTTKRGYKTLVVTPQQIYNEFSGGSQDVAALRDFIKMYYDKASSALEIPNSVLFFGDGSYDFKDRITGNTNLVPTYQTDNSLNKTHSYCTDDYFGFLDDLEDFNNYSFGFINTVDIGIGRIPVSTITEAKNVVDKIVIYDNEQSFGPWKNTMLFNADDEDQNVHLNDAENMSTYVRDSIPQFNSYKIYVDAYEQQSTPAGPRTPDAGKTFKDRLYNGTFLVNYNGHGGPLGWCEERILTIDDVNELSNLRKLPIFITATCDFTQFDNPNLHSAGELLLTNPRGGAIALMTTTRLVYVPGNGIMNINYFKTGFKFLNGEYPTLGDSYRLSKNIEYSNSLGLFDASNFRKFALIGDPGLPLAFPKHVVVTDSINGVSVLSYNDTLKALGKYTVSGHLEDKNGNPLPNFEGVVYPTIFDKAKALSTLGNDPGSFVQQFLVQNNILFNGKASVQNGKFSFTFVMPKDINYNVDKGKISYYANTTLEDATGYSLPLIGGSSNAGSTDNEGPKIEPFLNDFKFVNGGITKPNSLLLVKLTDSNGINYTGNSVGHDITAILDGNTQNTYVLNTFYEGEIDDYTRGLVKFPLEGISEGVHTLTIKAWDVFNNSSETQLDFVVVTNAEGQLAHVYNYPNPFSTNTQFMFEHNMPNQELNVDLKIFNISGRVVKQFKTRINTPGTRYDGIYWDGKDEYGDKLANGVYLYKLLVKGQNGFSDQKIQKLFILR